MITNILSLQRAYSLNAQLVCMLNKPHKVGNCVLFRLPDSEWDGIGVSEEVVDTGSVQLLTFRSSGHGEVGYDFE